MIKMKTPMNSDSGSRQYRRILDHLRLPLDSYKVLLAKYRIANLCQVAYLLRLCRCATIDGHTGLCVCWPRHDGGVIRVIAPVLAVRCPHVIHRRLEVDMLVDKQIGIVSGLHVL